MIDPISDMLTRIRNGQMALLPAVVMPHSKIKESIAHILKKEGYVSDVTVEGKLPKKLTLKLKYQGKKGVVEGLKRISSPGPAQLRRRDGNPPRPGRPWDFHPVHARRRDVGNAGQEEKSWR